MNRQTIVDIVERYVHLSAGWQAAKVKRVVRYWNAADAPEVLALVSMPARNGDSHEWCIRLGWEQPVGTAGAYVVLDDSLPGSAIQFVQERM